VKQERITKPNDEQGRHKIHGDHDNGVLYVERILKQLEAVTEIKPVVETVTITTSPNPVKDWFTVKLNLSQTAQVGIRAVSAQTRAAKVLLAEKELAAGNYQFTMNANGFAGGTGDIITIQLTVNGEAKTYKVMVAI
ncbi:MAG: hypothetical protein JNM68_09245, partial [Dinghuibacter sp.]|nr:hypothetical protein [Dinghuibacter sp.]